MQSKHLHFIWTSNRKSLSSFLQYGFPPIAASISCLSTAVGMSGLTPSLLLCSMIVCWVKANTKCFESFFSHAVSMVALHESTHASEKSPSENGPWQLRQHGNWSVPVCLWWMVHQQKVKQVSTSYIKKKKRRRKNVHSDIKHECKCWKRGANWLNAK